MAETYKRLNTTRAFTASASPYTTIYTVPALTTALVKKIVVSNNSGSSATAKLWHIPSGTAASAADNTHIILPTTTLAANEHGVDDGPFAMAAGDLIVAQGDGTNAINISIYGLEVS